MLWCVGNQMALPLVFCRSDADAPRRDLGAVASVCRLRHRRFDQWRLGWSPSVNRHNGLRGMQVPNPRSKANFAGLWSDLGTVVAWSQ